MAVKLSSRQQAIVAVLETFPPKFAAINRQIEELATMKTDEAHQRRLARQLDEMKVAAQSVGVNAVAETLGIMGQLARRTGGLQTRIRGLREGFSGLKINFEGAMRSATTPEAEEPVTEDGQPS